MKKTKALANPSGKIACRVTADCMVPRIRPGEWAIAEPGKQIAAGHDAVLGLRQIGAGGQPLTLVRRLVKRCRAGWLVEQYNPPRHYLIPHDEIAKAYRVTGYMDYLDPAADRESR